MPSQIERLGFPSTSYLRLKKWFESQTRSTSIASVVESKRLTERPAARIHRTEMETWSRRDSRKGMSQRTGQALEKGAAPATLSRGMPLEEEVDYHEKILESFGKIKVSLKMKKILNRKDFNSVDKIRRRSYRVERMGKF